MNLLIEVQDDKRRLYLLLGVVLLEVLVSVERRQYAYRTETLPATVVPCRHVGADIQLTNCQDIFVYGSFAQRMATMTNVTNIYWYGPKPTNAP